MVTECEWKSSLADPILIDSACRNGGTKSCFQSGVSDLAAPHLSGRPMGGLRSRRELPEPRVRALRRSRGGWSLDAHYRRPALDDKPRWSPDGKTIYFISGAGSFFNVWGIRFDPATGKTVGQPLKISRFDSQRVRIPDLIGSVGFSLIQDKVVFPMAEESGSIWMLDNVDR